MLRALIAACIAIVGAPAFAQDSVPTVDLFAKAATGLVDGGRFYLEPLGQSTVRQVRSGVYQVTTEDKSNTIVFSFTEPETCVVKVTAKATPPQPGGLRVDLARVTAITIEPRPAKGREGGWRSTILSPMKGISIDTGTRVEEQSSLESLIYTSVTGTEMETAIAKLIARCSEATETTQLPDDLAPADLLGVIFSGFVEGVPVRAGSGTSVVRESEGTFRLLNADGTPEGTLRFTDLRDCRFTYAASEAGGDTASAEFNANLLRVITVAPIGKEGDLTKYQLTMEGEPGLFTIIDAPNAADAPTDRSSSTMTTGLTRVELETAIERFRATCPGLG